MSLIVRHLYLFAALQMLKFTPHWGGGGESIMGPAPPGVPVILSSNTAVVAKYNATNKS